MNDEVREAIEAVQRADIEHPLFGRGKDHSFERLRHLLFRLTQVLPDEMTVLELRQELASGPEVTDD